MECNCELLVGIICDYCEQVERDNIAVQEHYKILYQEYLNLMQKNLAPESKELNTFLEIWNMLETQFGTDFDLILGE